MHNNTRINFCAQPVKNAVLNIQEPGPTAPENIFSKKRQTFKIILPLVRQHIHMHEAVTIQLDRNISDRKNITEVIQEYGKRLMVDS